MDGTGSPDGDSVDAAARLVRFADRLAKEFGPGVVDPDEDAVGFTTQPREGACPLYVLQWGDEFIFGVGVGSCRWELSRDRDDIDFIEAVSEAVIAGHVWEAFGPARSQVTVELLDGGLARTSAAQAPVGCLPWPFWTRSKKSRRAYLPY
jgi:hypothetical protein